MNIYYLNITALRNRDVFASKIKEIDSSRRAKIERYKSVDDKLRCLGAGILINFIRQRYHILQNPVSDKFGKLKFENADIAFNISHSGLYVIAVVSENEVGIDIQRIQSDKHRIAEKNFLPSECEYINRIEDDEIMQQRFCEVWTIKEAYLKNIGIGLRKPLNSFEIDLRGEQPKIVDNNRYSFVQFKMDGRYIVTVCVDGTDKTFDIEEVMI